MKKTRLRLKHKYIVFLKIIFWLLFFCFLIYCFYLYQLSTFTRIGYSKVASKNILSSGNKEFVLSIGENKSLNAAFESEYFEQKYISNYSKIKYYDYKNFIKNINLLLNKGYSNSDINIIFAHGNDDDICEFAKRDRIKYLEEFYDFPYAKLANYDRYINYTDETGEDEKTSVIYVNLNMDKEEYVDYRDVTKFSFDMLVNKYNKLSESFEPDDLYMVPKEYSDGEEFYANRDVVNAYIQMAKSAELDGMKFVVNSGYRSYQDQIDIAEYYRKWYGDSYVNKYVARPGFSEHQTGLTFDVGSKNTSIFVNSKEYSWLIDNAHKYGFIIRFTKKGEPITGFRSEPWHIRYVGKEIAKTIYEKKLTFEEYYVMYLDK